MPKEIISKSITVNRPEKITVQVIESLLNDKFGEILRWAIIETGIDTIKICVTYENCG